MKPISHSLLAVNVCLMFAMAVPGQTQQPAGNHSADASPIISGTAEADSTGKSNISAAGAQAVVPRLMKFSGVLHDAVGNPLTGAVDVTFALYSAEAGGDALWFETQSVQADDLGRYTALLGAMHTDGLPIDLFTSGEVRWLGIQVGSKAEQQPRVLLVSVPYALKAGDAETLGGKPASAYMLSDTKNGTGFTTTASASTTSASETNTSGEKMIARTANVAPLTACGSVTSDGLAAVNSIALFTTACNIEGANLVQFNGNLGFGTTLPQARLHIFGPTIPDSDAHFNFILGDSTPAAAGVGGGIQFSGYYNGTTNKAGFANIRGVKENATQGDYASAMVFDTRASGGNQTERMRITSKGNVGIGTSTPAAKLEVEGAINVSGNDNVDRDARYNIFSFDKTPAAAGTGGGVGFAGYYSGTSQGAGFANIRGVKENSTQGDYASAMIFDTRANGGGQAERMRISSTGNVGIGTANPLAKLDVAGSINASGNITSATGAFTVATGTFSANTPGQVLNVTQAGAGSAAVLNATGGGAILTGEHNGTGVFSVDNAGAITTATDINLAPATGTTGPGVGVLSLGGAPFMHACCGNGHNNTFLGQNAGNFTTTGVSNTGIGYLSLVSNTSGGGNTASGYATLDSNSSGGENTAFGIFTLNDNTTGSYNTAVGSTALWRNCDSIATGCTANYNMAAGYYAGVSTNPGNGNVTGQSNTFIGAYSGPGTSTPVNNATAIGANAVVGESNALVLGSINSVNGATSSVNVGIGTTTPAHTLDIVGDINTTANITSGGVFTGSGAGLINLNASNLSSGTVPSGQISGTYGNSVTFSNFSNVYYGDGSHLTGVGSITGISAGFGLSGGGSSGSVGMSIDTTVVPQLNINNTFSQVQSVATGAGAALMASTNDANTAAAIFSNANSSGDVIEVLPPGGIAAAISNPGPHKPTGPIMRVTAALDVMTSGNLQGSNFNTGSNNNTFVGASAGNSLVTGLNNTATGNQALGQNSTGTANTALGGSTLYNNTTANQNTALGYEALLANCFNVSGTCNASNNTAVGFQAGYTTNIANANTMGAGNTFIGSLSGPGTSTQLSNATAIGANAVVGQSNALVLGSISGVNGATSSVNVGIGTQTPGEPLDVVGNVRTTTCFLAGSTPVGGTCSSDARLKTDIQPFSPLLDKIAQLQPVHYHWRVSEFPQYHFGSGLIPGLVAQDVEKIFPEMVSEDSRGFKMVNYSELPFLLLESVRELKAENDELRARIKAQEERARSQKDEEVAQLRREVEELRALVTKSAVQRNLTGGQPGK